MNPVNDAISYHNALMLLTQSYGAHLQKLADRINQLEQENAELKKRPSTKGNNGSVVPIIPSSDEVKET